MFHRHKQDADPSIFSFECSEPSQIQFSTERFRGAGRAWEVLDSASEPQLTENLEFCQLLSQGGNTFESWAHNHSNRGNSTTQNTFQWKADRKKKKQNNIRYHSQRTNKQKQDIYHVENPNDTKKASAPHRFGFKVSHHFLAILHPEITESIKLL